jgi:hypothetical protein
MMKTSDTRPRYDSPSPYATRSLFQGLLLESTVDAILVVIIEIRSEQPLQMHLVDSNPMVQQFAAAASHPALGNTVLPRTTNGGPHSLDIHDANCGGTSVPHLES